ncbi:hypothetical protein BDW62DRAFT_158653 [Aspergillus aurantiobrunneus]
MSFLSVNNISSPPDRAMDDAFTTSATPRPHSDSMATTQDAGTSNDIKEEAGLRVVHMPDEARRSTHSISDETIQADSDGEREGSDHESERKEHAPPSKKKKGQRFYCTEFPPCSLSFTRSEHLARHIRKHTGERPFQCHCSRRFSRLDNLRQHAQTVHVNEEIPGDSLAATGTRFQRQIRTDRVRPQGRARAGTGGSQGAHSRGHSRNLSTSSIASTTSTFSQTPELRRRPPPLIMANDASARSRLALDPMMDTPTTPPGQVRALHAHPGGSPYTPSRMYPGNASPMPASAQAGGFWDGKTAARRLSVPSGGNLFVPAHYGQPYPAANYPAAGELYASPVSGKYPMPKDEREHIPTEAELRRRTWHYSTWPNPSRTEYSGIANSQTSETFPPAPGGNESDRPPRLPGIESFDHFSGRPMTPPVRRLSPMQVETQHKPPAPGYNFSGGFNYAPPSGRPPPPISGPGHRRGHVSWDMSLHTNLTGLHIRDKPMPQRDASHWGQQTISEIRNIDPRPSSSYQQQLQESRGHHSHNSSSYSTAASSTHAARTSPEDSSSSEGVHTPSTASLEYHPAIVQNNGYVEAHHPPFPSDTSQTVRSRYPGGPVAIGH